MSIEVRKLSKRFGDFTALDQVDLQVNPGELLALLGPSGCGKTTLLRMIAGLDQPDAGQILFSGEDATRRHVSERQVGFVFQHYALFRHMTVFDNVAFGLSVKPRATRPGKAEIRERVMSLLKLVQLDWLANAYPAQLSGGQRQRIALARSLAVEPKVLLLDEPFGALDAKVRKDLRRWLRDLHDEIHLTSVFVTHDQEEALEVSDRVVVMNHGRIEQVGAPDEIYEHPATPFVTHFLGDVNLFHGRVEQGQLTIGPFAHHVQGVDDSERAVAYVRPHDLDISRDPAGALAQGRVEHIHAVGPLVRLELRRDDAEPIEVALAKERYRELALAPGDLVYVRPRKLAVFPDVQDYVI
ncbi:MULTISPECIES: sulfate/molybdate ABC transporter ATP-binding protein [unclassified Paludibacterium]|uniref:sulfate/molybdate ABC transporter ATP-binding protein n=1 Tax=unclassified Paludibacterium TaxID=2618429 RepID=UPI001C05BC72|nr:sulfate ABC transporter ATP-binding protein [Paludibacterium sp. B53371]BEV72463.1 sulfate ABC transporter ATP-binding protein [Paludibacterium sp. THUN1379]